MEDTRNKEIIIGNREDILSDRLDLMKFIANVHLRIKKDITADFVMAKLDEKSKEAIIEMTENAYFAYRILSAYALKSKVWVEEDGNWKKKNLTEARPEEAKRIVKVGSEMFDSYMTRLYMMVILNRNIDKNYIINVLSEYKEEEIEKTEKEEIGTMNKLKQLLKPRGKEKEED